MSAITLHRTDAATEFLAACWRAGIVRYDVDFNARGQSHIMAVTGRSISKPIPASHVE